jgi:hypothetical protein
MTGYTIPGEQGHRGGQVATGAVSHDHDAVEVDAEVVGVGGGPGGRGVTILGRGRVGVLRGAAVVDRHDHASRTVADGAADAVVRIEVAQHPTTAVEEDHDGQDRAEFRTVHPNLERPAGAVENLVGHVGHRLHLDPHLRPAPVGCVPRLLGSQRLHRFPGGLHRVDQGTRLRIQRHSSSLTPEGGSLPCQRELSGSII